MDKRICEGVDRSVVHCDVDRCDVQELGKAGEMNRRDFMATLGGVVAGACGLKWSGKLFKGKPIFWDVQPTRLTLMS